MRNVRLRLRRHFGRMTKMHSEDNAVLQGSEDTVLEVSRVSKYFGAVRALNDVDLTLHTGEVVGVVGDNGAGKSTLVNVLAGSLKPDGGTIRVDGIHQEFHGPADARAVGIETVFQSLSLIPTLDITENIFLGRELFTRGSAGHWLKWMAKARMRREVRDGLDRLELTLPPGRTKVSALSGGQRQAVAIARAVLWGSHIVILDEPAAALGVRQTEMVLQFIEDLKSHGVAVIVVSHNMEHILRVSDRVMVMRLGKRVLDTDRRRVTEEQLIGAITGVRYAEGV